MTNGMVLVHLDNGSLFLNDKTGVLIRNMFIGSVMVTQPAIGTDVNGKTEIILPAEMPVSTGIYATTGRTTSTRFLYGVSLGPAPTTSATTVTSVSTAAGSATTVTATAPGTVTTATQTVVSSSGISSTTFYAVAVIAAIFIIATGYLAMSKGKKPAS